MIRFTPRKPTSNWSAVNIEKVKKLTELGLMKPEGLEAYEKRKEEKSKVYSYEQNNIRLDKSYEEELKKHKKTWVFFSKKLQPSYRKTSIKWVMSAKREETRLRRLKTLIQSSSNEEKIDLLKR